MKNNIINKSATSFGALVAAVIFLIFVIIVSMSGVIHADNGVRSGKGRLITIHDRGTEKVIRSEAATIGDVLKEAGITVDEKDAVEPATDEKLIASDYQVNIYRARPVIVIDGNSRIKVITPYQTALQIAESVGIKLYDEDIASLARVDDILAVGAGLQLTIVRATPYEFTLYGKTTTARTQADTVGGMLSEKGIELGIDDKVLPGADTKITEGLSIKVWREGIQTITVEESVEFETEIIENIDREVSYREVQTAGEKGLRNATYEIVVQDGKEVSRKEIASLTTKQPIKQVEVVGVKGKYNTPSENETITWNFLIANGLSRLQAAGIMGNLMQEHHFNTTGDGLAQWSGSRRDELYSRPYPNNIYTQLDFLMYELTTKYSDVYNDIKASNSLTDVVLLFQNKFERCGDCRESTRIMYAQNILASH